MLAVLKSCRESESESIMMYALAARLARSSMSLAAAAGAAEAARSQLSDGRSRYRHCAPSRAVGQPRPEHRDQADRLRVRVGRFTDETRFFYNSCHSMAPTAHICGFPQGSNQEEFHPGKLQREFHLANLDIRSLKNSTRHTLYEHPQPLWQRFRKWRTDKLFQNLQLITLLLSSTEKPIAY